MYDGNLHLGRRGRLGARAVAISFDLDHRRSFFFHDFLDELAVGSVLDFESTVECFHVRHLVDFALAMESVDKSLQNAETHFAQGIGGLIAVNLSIQIRLGECLQTEFFV